MDSFSFSSTFFFLSLQLSHVQVPQKSQSGIHQLEQGSVAYSPQAKSSPPPVCVNRASPEHSQAHLFTCRPGLLSHPLPQSRVVATETIWPLRPRRFPTGVTANLEVVTTCTSDPRYRRTWISAGGHPGLCFSMPALPSVLLMLSTLVSLRAIFPLLTSCPCYGMKTHFCFPPKGHTPSGPCTEH